MPVYLRVLYLLVVFPFLVNAQKKEGLVVKYTFNDAKVLNEAGADEAKAYGVSWSEDRFGNAHSACYLQGNADSYLNLGSDSKLKPSEPVYKGTGFDNNPILYTRAAAGDDFNDAYVITYHYNLRKLCCNTTLSENNATHLFPTTVSYLRQWYHVVITYDNKYLSLYINGVLEGKAAKKFRSEFLEGDSVLIGMHYGTKNKRFFQGSVDDIYIFNRVISPSEIKELYNAPNPNRVATIFKWIFYCFGVIVFVLIILWIIRWRTNKALKIEKEKNQLKNNWYEQENRVLTAQMDPHFIFNALNTIQQFIIIQDNEKAQLYLTKFSRLLRMILESNVKDHVTLKEEIEIVTQYLQIESLRFNNVFAYTISIEKTINPDIIHIPRFLIQPFVENAIWHGLLPKEGEKQVSLSFEYRDENALFCVIEDNGVGRKEDTASAEKNRSLAINFIQQRLQLMSKIYKENYDLSIIDKLDDRGNNTGTKIILTIPILKM